uniref:UDP-glucuronosyltransferase 2B7 n=3 Tax=Lygus hesperus TaxID=30085 RepID=A0A146M6V5_LYGHE
MKSSMLIVPLLFCGSALAANILVLLPLPFTSHVLTFKPLFIELAKKGHNVTYIGALSLPETQNLHQTLVKNSTIDELLEKLVAALRETDQWGFLSYFWHFGSQLIDIMLDHPAFQNLIYDESSHFDVIITEPYFLHEPLVAFGQKFNAPVIGIFPLSPTIWGSYLSGNPMPFSYVPSYKTPFTDHMNLNERIQNTLIQLYEFIGTKYYYLPKQEEVVRNKMKFKGSENLPPLQSMLKNVSLHLIDYHFSSGYNRPFENNILQVGGLNLARAKIEPLDKELSDLMDKSKGVIYFSMGSHVKTSELGEDAVREIVKAFAQLSDYQVFMKWDGDFQPLGLPPNVKISKWFPQPSVLGHPKTKVMIGHGGLHGIMECIHHGVPFLGIPQFSDQESNTRFVVSSGFGLRVGKDELTSEKLLGAVRALLTKPEYKENAVKRSKIALDRVMAPLDLAVYGVEYVLRHQGAPHLRPAVLDLPWYQYILVDVISIIIIVPLVILFIVLKLSSWCRPFPPDPVLKK